MAQNKRKRAAKKAAREAEKAAKRHPKLFWTIVAIILIIVIAAAVYYFLVYRKQHGDLDFGGTNNPQTQTPGASNVEKGELADIAKSDLSVHFLELGVANVGDCVLIKSGNTEVLIDAGAKSKTAPTQEMLDYVATYCTDGVLEYVIATHAHEDHIAGLVGKVSGTTGTGFLYQYNIGTIIQFARTDSSSAVYKNYVNATQYCADKGTNVYTALDCVKGQNGAQATYYLNKAKTVSMTILYQKYYETKASTENNYSVCMLLSQKSTDGTNHYLFTGDLEKSGETSLAESNELPHCVLYKGGHHGSSTSSNDVLLKEITPENIAICTCAGTYEYASKPTEDHPDRYLNTFPTQEAIDRMAKYTNKIYVTTVGILNADYSTQGFTSMNGTIVFYYGEKDGVSALRLWCSNNTTILKDTEWFKNNRTWNGV